MPFSNAILADYSLITFRWLRQLFFLVGGHRKRKDSDNYIIIINTLWIVHFSHTVQKISSGSTKLSYILRFSQWVKVTKRFQSITLVDLIPSNKAFRDQAAACVGTDALSPWNTSPLCFPVISCHGSLAARTPEPRLMRSCLSLLPWTGPRELGSIWYHWQEHCILGVLAIQQCCLVSCRWGILGGAAREAKWLSIHALEVCRELVPAMPFARSVWDEVYGAWR